MMPRSSFSQASVEIARVAIEEKLISKACTDPEFRKALIAHPRETIAAETGVTLADSVSVEVHEETGAKLHLVLPLRPTHGNELSDDQLAQMSGGNAAVTGICDLIEPHPTYSGITAKGSK